MSAVSVHVDTVRFCLFAKGVLDKLASSPELSGDGNLAGAVQAVRTGIDLLPEVNGSVRVSVSPDLVAYIDEAGRALGSYSGSSQLCRHLAGIGLAVSGVIDTCDRVIAEQLDIYKRPLIAAGGSEKAFDSLNLYQGLR